jgi:hypothetical protein
MPDSCPCETLWLVNPTALFGTNLLVTDVCEANNINAFSRSVILGLVLAGMASPFLGWAGFGLIVLALLFLYSRWLFAYINKDRRAVETAPKQTKEGFEANIRPDMKEANAFPYIATSPAATIVTRPTAANPFMNVLLDELKYNPTRAPAAAIGDPTNRVNLDDYFRVQWTSDPTDVFGRSQSQRQFYTMPSTSIPNDQGSFQNWLYLIPGKTCREGGRDACIPGTNGAPIPWLSQPN